MADAKETCRFIKPDGARCATVNGLSKAGYCWAHRPDRQPRRRKHGATLPAASEIPDPPQDAASGKDYLSWIVDAVARGALDSRSARDMASVVHEIIFASERADLDSQVAALKRQIEALKG